jgi:type 1 fimbriae regulatory protein FimB/type 1 fimbriae regulatory protein FimE
MAKKTKTAAPVGPPRKQKWKDERGFRYLNEKEMEQVRDAAGRIGRHRHRDKTMILVAFRHGLRVKELINLRRGDVDLDEQTIHIKRVKGSKPGTHDLARVEVTALRRVLKEAGRTGRDDFLFQSERDGDRLTTSAVFKMMRRAGGACDPPIVVSPHMLRHGCGFHLINRGEPTRRIQDHLGHRNISVTELYTELAPDRQRRKLWDD